MCNNDFKLFNNNNIFGCEKKIEHDFLHHKFKMCKASIMEDMQMMCAYSYALTRKMGVLPAIMSPL
jgi:hypothetical protein